MFISVRLWGAPHFFVHIGNLFILVTVIFIFHSCPIVYSCGYVNLGDHHLFPRLMAVILHSLYLSRPKNVDRISMALPRKECDDSAVSFDIASRPIVVGDEWLFRSVIKKKVLNFILFLFYFYSSIVSLYWWRTWRGGENFFSRNPILSRSPTTR